MKIVIEVAIEFARNEMCRAIQKMQDDYGLPLCIIDGLISSKLAEMREIEKTTITNTMNTMLNKKNEELEKAKQAAKKVLRTELEQDEPDGSQEEVE